MAISRFYRILLALCGLVGVSIQIHDDGWGMLLYYTVLSVKLETDEKMTIGYIARKASVMSEMGNKFLEELSKYKDKVLA